MSNETAVVPKTNLSPVAAKLQEDFAKLDVFAAENSVTAVLDDGQGGAFSTALRMATAVSTLRDMITPEMMKPIMALQGTALGFRTDKDKDGGYPMEIVKEAIIEGALKGFRPTGNEMNIIAGRFYAARDGFERIFRDLGKSGRVTNLKPTPSLPKTQADGAVVDYSATWNFKKTDGVVISDELKLSIPVKVNQGQGADAILGKAKRKMLAAIYSRITGTEITDGDVDDPRTIDVTTTAPKADAKPAAALPAELLAELDAIVGPYGDKATAFLLSNGSIQKGQTWKDVSETMARKIVKQKASFYTSIGVA